MTRVAVVGAGNVSAQYLQTLRDRPEVTFTAVVDRISERAEAFADQVPSARVLTLDQVLQDETVDVVLNLTTPTSHEEVTTAALAAGKSVASEKPFTLTAAAARTLSALAAREGLPVACAPDTMLGTGLQTARRLVDDGAVGRPISAHAAMICAGHERWHPQPDFFYRSGGGPLFDMGPYHLSALVHLLGPVQRVVGLGSRLRPDRTIGRGPRAGEVLRSEVDTHQTGLLLHHGGAITTLVTSFDSVGTRAPSIEVHGTDGALVVPDPNHFEGQVLLRRTGSRDWTESPVLAGQPGTGRGIGLVDLVRATREGRPPRACLDLAVHVVEIIEGLHRSAAAGGAPVDLQTRPVRPDPVPLHDLD